MRIDAQAAGVAAYDLVQKIFLLLIERRALSVADAQVILREFNRDPGGHHGRGVGAG